MATFVVVLADEAVLKLNQSAQARLQCPNRLAVVEGATHLFEERGTLAEAAILASDWFVRHLLQAGNQRATERSDDPGGMGLVTQAGPAAVRCAARVKVVSRPIIQWRQTDECHLSIQR